MINLTEQGDILRIEGIKDLVLVLSKNYYNKSSKIVGCPIVKNARESILNVHIKTKDVEGVALCDQLRNLDISVRGYQIVSKIDISDKMLVSDIVQGIFDYI